VGNQAHVSLLIRFYALLKNDDVQGIFTFELPEHGKTVDMLVADIEAYFVERDLRVGYGDIDGWGVFPLTGKKHETE